MNIVSKHFTKKGAHKEASKRTAALYASQMVHKSSGWSRIKYRVVPIRGRLRKWGVKVIS